MFHEVVVADLVDVLAQLGLLDDETYIKYPVPGRGGDSHGRAQGLTCTQLRPDCMYLEGVAGFRAAIRAHYFALISMVGAHTTELDAQIKAAVDDHSGYVLLPGAGGGAPTWIYPPDYPASSAGRLAGLTT